MDKLFIAIPVYNEERSIEMIARKWHSVVDSVRNGSKLFVFNDGSTDGTSEILNRLKNKYRNRMIVKKKNSGHGPTCTETYKFAVSEGADWIFQTDSDDQTKSDKFWRFWEKRDDYDFIVDHRVNRRDGLARIFISKVLLSVSAVGNKENIIWQEISFTRGTSGKTSIPLFRFGGLGIRLFKESYQMRN